MKKRRGNIKNRVLKKAKNSKQTNIQPEKSPQRKSKIDFRVLAISFLVVILTASIGGMFTSFGTNTAWYEQTKSALTPPGFVFSIVWSVLFFLIALALYFSWTKSDKKQKHELIFVFTVNLLLNAVWSFLFFFLKNPTFAFFELIALWISIIIMIFAVYKINKLSAFLLLPYFFWVSFAAALNYLSAFT